MKHVSPDFVMPAGAAAPQFRNRWEQRRARLLRWADLLDAHDGAFQLFTRIETVRRADFALLRVADSPIGVAFKDPVLRVQGLRGDTLDDAMRFFDLSVNEAHWALCDCHFAGSETGISPGLIAGRLRKTASQVTVAERCSRVWHGLRALWPGR